MPVRPAAPRPSRRRSRLTKLLLAAVVAVASFVALPTTAANASPEYKYWDSSSTWIYPPGGFNLQGDGGQFIFQTDGNLVLYSTFHKAIWSSQTNGRGKTFSLQDDGHLVVRNAQGAAIWASSWYMPHASDLRYRIGDAACGEYGAYFVGQQSVRSGSSFPSLVWYANDVWKQGQC